MTKQNLYAQITARRAMLEAGHQPSRQLTWRATVVCYALIMATVAYIYLEWVL
jgi:hypothetical protein